MHVPFMGMDDAGNVLIPFTVSADDIPFGRWQMVSTKIWESPGPVAVRSIILTHKGEVFIQYAREVNDENEYPKEEVKEIQQSLIYSDEKRKYE